MSEEARSERPHVVATPWRCMKAITAPQALCEPSFVCCPAHRPPDGRSGHVVGDHASGFGGRECGAVGQDPGVDHQ